jgi:hypothetical protein
MRFVARRLSARETVGIALGALVLGVLIAEAALVLLAAPLLGRVINDEPIVKHDGVFSLLRLSARGATAAVAVWLPLAGLRAWINSRREMRQVRVLPGVGEHHWRDGVEFVRLNSSTVTAYSVGGRDPQIVVSDGLVRLLEPAELDAVLDHEMAHVREYHGTILRLLTALEAAAPPARGITARVRLLIERDADEEATSDEPERRAALLDALLKVSGMTAPTPLAAFTPPSGVVERAEALLDAPVESTRLHRVGNRLALSGATAFGIAGAGGSVMGLRMLMGAAGICFL